MEKLFLSHCSNLKSNGSLSNVCLIFFFESCIFLKDSAFFMRMWQEYFMSAISSLNAHLPWTPVITVLNSSSQVRKHGKKGEVSKARSYASVLFIAGE